MNKSNRPKTATLPGSGKNEKKHIPSLVIGLVILAAGAIGYYVIYKNVSPAGGAQASISLEASRIAYPVSMFEDGRAHHFDYQSSDLTIRYFILKSSDGVIRAAFDACDVCWRAGKGYHQEGNNMVCGNCGRRFASTRINEVQGGCNPAPLMRTVQGDQLILQVEDIINGSSYFNFKEKA